MADDPRIQQLLDELLDTPATPEEVCGSCPELLPVVRDRWQELCRLQVGLDAMFPPPGNLPPRPPDESALPQVPGYEVEGVLGRGGMGVVFRARHLRLDRLVAVKMMLAGAYAAPRERDRFQREAVAVARLRHPNIVQVHDVGEHDNRPYFTMELMDGGSLAHKLAGTPQLAREAAQLVSTLAGAVQAAHGCGIVHRDLKPSNILLTADGTPKISDFGLARRMDTSPSLSQTCVVVGTPSYMAPEQARGRRDAVGPAVDVYALGAILYECLTGRPPFRAATAAETVQQVISQEPAPPSRLNDQVPRDLETIWLKCLHKEPGRRYASAAALAEDLGRFGEGRPIRARPVGWAERSWRWVRRNPVAAALVATAVALVGLGSGGGVWFVQQRDRHDAELRRDIDAAVTQAASLRRGFRFDDARQLLEQARQRLASGGPDDLRRQVEQALADLNLAKMLDAARLRAATLVEGRYVPGAAEPHYASAFAEAGLGFEGDDIGVVAARVRGSAVRAEIVAALDDWASITRDPRRREWLLAVARGADPHSVRDRLRHPDLWQDGARLNRLVLELNEAELSPQLAAALVRVPREASEAMALLTAAQTRFPQDFWLNFRLGVVCYQARRLDEALSHNRAALALRPEVSVAYSNLGAVLRERGQVDEAIGYLDQALRLDPKNVSAHNNLGSALLAKGQLDEAIGRYQQALKIDPEQATTHNLLGAAFGDKGQLDEAIGHYQQALKIDPEQATTHNNLGIALSKNGRQEEAIDHFQQAVRLDPKLAVARRSLASALHAKGQLDEAIGHLQQALKIDPKSALSHNNLGGALRDKGRLEEAIDHFQQAVRLEPNLTQAQINLGTTLYDAASAAVRTAAVRGSEEGRHNEPERADNRGQALRWLRSHLEVTARLLTDRKVTVKALVYLQTDPALASVRDPAALAKLPDAECAQWQRFWADVAALIAADPLEQVRAFAARRDWAQAADVYARALKRGPTDDGHFWFEYAALLMLSGDRPGYEKACAHMIETCGKAGGPRSYHVARACTLAPDSVAEPSRPGRLAERELRESARQFWSLTEQGALAYRASRYQDAVPLFEQSLVAESRSGCAVVNWLWLALTNHRLGKADDARRWLVKAQTWLDQYREAMPARAEQELGLHLHNWLEAHVLRREAESVIRSANP
jgi:tetratricopeptide (TPR) repeat protein